MVEHACEYTAKRRADEVLPHVVGEHALWVHWIPGDLHDELSNGQGWVQTRKGERIDVAKGPENETDGWNTPDAEVGTLSVLASHVEDVEDEDESHDHLHVAS